MPVHHVLCKEQSGTRVHDALWLQVVVGDGVNQRERSFIGSLAVRGYECRSGRVGERCRRSRRCFGVLAVGAGSEPDDKTDTDDQTLHTSKAMSLWS